ncbi:MAG: 8-amino-7-oxononanoate synthase [Armatimonadota bacterium]|nr:8-amino-7-oxononanoate synthase [Armatimonadota bacterium]MDR7471046.1 8-amino-7-oxononanoate synthase [Armatimonadota bacterium]MDR7475333.1 8-amino-7-oxononanoate synthase [Armatimonadota bacterium]MDR7539171.1 8-amino-7-oxononanoate synthase [Armatimonadota bacterium]
MDPISRRISELATRVASIQRRGIYPYLQPVAAIDGAHVTIGRRRMLLASSYSYLGLLGDPRITAAAQEALACYGTGTHGVRLLAGNTDLHDRAEERIARFVGAEACVLYSSGYLANFAAISALVGRNDVVICDKLNHASIVDGCLLSGARFVRVPHNDMTAFDRALAGVPEGVGRLVVVDAVFSMDGDVINLPALTEICRRHGAWLMVDESHSLGVLGPRGEGIEAHFCLPGVIDIKMSSVSKSIPSAGGYIAGRRDLITFLKHASRAFVFSAALPPASAAAVMAALDVMEAEPHRVARLRAHVRRLRGALRAGGISVRDDPTPIIPVIVGDDERAWHLTHLLDERGIFVLPIVPPAVPPSTSRLRVTVTAAHSEQEVDAIAAALLAAWREVALAPAEG